MQIEHCTKAIRVLLDANGLADWSVNIDLMSMNNDQLGRFNREQKQVILNKPYVESSEYAHIHSKFSEVLLDIKNPDRVKKHQLVHTCPICRKIAKIKARTEFESTVILTYECNHIEIKDIPKSSPFHEMVFDGDAKCHHDFNKYDECTKCNAHRLHQYQIEGARFIERSNGRFALFDDMGVGKTIQALAYLKFNSSTAMPYLWVTKSKVKYQHMKEIIRLLGIEYIPQIIAGSKTHFVKHENLKGYIISYDLFRRLDLSVLENIGLKTIILDECQAIKNPDSARTQALRDVVKNIPKIIPLSGTPWKNRGSELFVVLNMLDPKMFWNFKAFKERHIRYYIDQSSGKEKEGGFKNPEQFREQISHIAIRRELREVLPELPPINRQKLYCEVPEHARLVYNDKVKEIQKLLRNAAIDGTENSAKVQQQVDADIMVMRHIVGLAKVSGVVEHLQEFIENTERKIVCFVHHIDVGNLIFEQMSKWCKEVGLALPVRLLGGTSAQDTNDVQDEFNDGATKLGVFSTLAGGEGLNLQYNCYDGLIAERQWNPANEEQPERRLLRHGQKSPVVNMIYALGDKTVDMTVFDKMVEQKRFEFESSMNKAGYANEWNPVNLRKELINAILSEVA